MNKIPIALPVPRMRFPCTPAAVLLAASVLASTGAAQVPQGHYVFSTFGKGQTGLFISHPRAPGNPVTITGMRGDLAVTGASCVVHRPSDGAILCGERAQVNSSVDLHMILIRGSAVQYDASFSVGTGGSCCGEIPQMGLLPDGRVVVAGTDIASGPLSLYKTTSYGYQGVGIVDTTSGAVTVVPISNGASIVDVFNGLAVAPDAQSVFLGTYVSAAQGDIYQVPLPAGGAAKLVATVPAGLSNMAFDNLGDLWVTTLDATQALFRVEIATGRVHKIPQTNGALNGICNDPVSGNFAVVSGSGGTPTKSIYWMEPNGKDHLLSSPGLATPSGIAVHLNPIRFGRGTTAGETYDWLLEPNPGGLPEPGNTSFSLTVRQTGTFPSIINASAICAARLETPVELLGAEIWVDLSSLLVLQFHAPAIEHKLPLGIPNNPALTGIQLFVQTLHQEATGGVGATPAVAFTVL